MATAVQFAEYVRFKTRTNSTTFTDANIIILMRQRQDEIAKAILKADEDILLIPQKANLVASTITAREYPIPSDIFARIKRVEGALDGSTYVEINEIDITSVDKPLSTETNITDIFGNGEGEAFYDILRKSIFIYSGTITAGTDTLRMWANTYPTAITDLAATADLSQDPSTTTHGIPRALHEIWARGVIIDWKQSREKAVALSEKELSYDKDLDNDVATLKHGNLDREVIADLPPAVDRGNDGADY